jgi:hypothetical protein
MTSDLLDTLPPVIFARTEVFITFVGDPRGAHGEANGPARWQPAPRTRGVGHGISELLPHFRRLMGGEESAGSDGPRWEQLQLDPELLGLLKQRLSVSPAKVEGPPLPLRISAVTATLFPQGDGLLGLEFEWNVDGDGLTVAAMANALPVLRRIHGSHTQRFHPFWSLPAPKSADGLIGALFKALPAGGLHLQDLATALLGDADRVRLNGSDLASLHTSLVLAAPIRSDEATKAAVFHLGHAAPTSFVPPTSLDKQTRRLEPRGNRHVVLTREGATAISWPTTDAARNSEMEWARNRFFGVYRLLHMHVHAERLAIATLNDRAATFSNKLDDERLLEQQGDIERLLVEVTRYTLSLTGEDCGGNGDHVAFFSVLRAVHRIPQQRDELRAEIDELRGLLRAVENRREKATDAEERRFQKRVSVFGIYAVPLTLALAVLGANIDCNGQTYSFPVLESLFIVALGGAFGGVTHAWTNIRDRRLARSQEPSLSDDRPS